MIELSTFEDNLYVRGLTGPFVVGRVFLLDRF